MVETVSNCIVTSEGAELNCDVTSFRRHSCLRIHADRNVNFLSCEILQLDDHQLPNFAAEGPEDAGGRNFGSWRTRESKPAAL